MKIALIGYGKMGKEIEQQAIPKGHDIVLKVDEHNAKSFTAGQLAQADVAIEFSTPETACSNILKCFDAGVPVVVGTTGWYDEYERIRQICIDKKQALFTATNFSIGVNIFFEINQRLAALMNDQPAYDVTVKEIHHLQKLDAPSGTAITLANAICQHVKRKTSWISVEGRDPDNISTQIENLKADPDELVIASLRMDKVPGVHTIKYNSDVDCIEITHSAHNRKGFASGALLAAEWISGRQGVFGMQDLLKF